MNRPEGQKIGFEKPMGTDADCKNDQDVNDDPLSNLSLSDKQGRTGFVQ